MSASAIQAAVIDELRLCAAGAAPTMRELRLTLDCTAPELAGAIQALRYQGKLEWDRLALSDSMKSAGASTAPKPAVNEGGTEETSPAVSSSGPDDEDEDDRPTPPAYPTETNDEAEQGPQGDGPLPAEGAAGNGAVSVRPEQPALPRGGVEEPRPGEPGAQPAGAGHGAETDAAGHEALSPVKPASAGFVPRHLLHAAGLHAANTRAASRPIPAPEHEPEIARLVREEVNEAGARRRLARSTATVRLPLELKKYGIPDLSVSEAIGTMLSDDPKAIMRAVSRKHPELWRRAILLGRSIRKSPMQALYEALERGLEALEAEQPSDPSQQEQAA